MAVNFAASNEEIEMFNASDITSSQRSRIERRLARTLLYQYVQKYSMTITVILSTLVIIQQTIIFFAVSRPIEQCSAVKIDQQRSLSKILNVIRNLTMDVNPVQPIPSGNESADTSFESGSTFPRIKTGKIETTCEPSDCSPGTLNFVTVANLARCSFCSKGLIAIRVFQEFHSRKFGVEYEFEEPHPEVISWDENDWRVFNFNNISSHVLGSFSLLWIGTDEKLLLQWRGLQVVQ